jgi:formate hydrogenlyase subunit 3/multisubunit Na+/H+ antiporter MnhD subunit
MQTLLLIIGSVTIIAAVKMALVQHDMKRLLGYHAVSQVGYMVLGFGTGNPIGIMGGLFHMLNHAIYKCSLFLSAGVVESRTEDSDLDNLGGVARFMPLTFIVAFISSMAISGVPPFNGFVSKWMIYQGIISLNEKGDKLWMIWLCASMFGSALTLASFIKFLHATFLGEMSDKLKQKVSRLKEVNIAQIVPMAILAILSIIFGIFAFKVPVPYIGEAVDAKICYLGFWQAPLATIFILIGIFIGWIIYIAGNSKAIREADVYIGGENVSGEMRLSGVNFYDTIKNLKGFRLMYSLAHRKVFDIYDQGFRGTFYFTGLLQKLHSGVLLNYLSWAIFGLAALLVIFLENLF